MICPTCGAPAIEGTRFCETDGTPLLAKEVMDAAASAAACRCGAGRESIDEQGFCIQCGRKAQKQPRDHVEFILSATFGGVTDRGKRHSQNEDDLLLSLEMVEGKPVSLLIVCDGVSSSETPQEASAAACAAASDVLLKAVREGGKELQEAMRQAIRAANQAVCALPYPPEGKKDPPETTIVAAVVRDGMATIGWVGDSRAYWIGASGGGLLTHDHSWVNEQIDAGLMTEQEASRAPEAHAITRSLGLWEGEVSEEASEASVMTFALPLLCRLLLCSDGLWNYAPQPEQIARLIEQISENADALTIARRLVEYANLQGGRDNITVAVASF